MSVFSKIGAATRDPRVLIPAVTTTSLLVLVGGSWLIFRSWLVALVIALVVVLIGLVIFLLRTIFSQEREQRLERGIEERGAAAPAPSDAAAAGAGSGLENGFRRALAEIRSSRLGREGIYTLPWHLVLGESGSGKTEALRGSGLDLPAEHAHIRRAGPTQDCDWWLTNQSIVLDTSGRYMESEKGASAEEWRKLLGLLQRSRPKGPIDGLIVAVPVTTLLGRSPAEREEQARTLRRRINELTDALRYDVPIYVLVTKSDMIEGFSETVSALPPDRLREAFGWTNDQRSFAEAGEIVLRGLDGVRERLERMVPEMVLREADPRRRRRIFLFPQEFGEACRSLAQFLNSAFAPSVYDEVPFLRGVYFTSARREGTTISPVLQRLGQDWARTALGGEPDSGRPLFFHDVFREIIVGDRDLALPTNWMGRRTRRFAVGFTAAASLAAVVLFGISFVENFRVVRRLSTESGSVLSGASNLASIERLRAAIVGALDGGSTLSGLGLHGNTERAAQRATRTFLWAFGREFEIPSKDRLIGKVRAFDRDSFEALAALAVDVSWIGSRAREEDASRPDLVPYAPVGGGEADVAAFRSGYDDFVRWAPDEELRSRIERERDVVGSAAGRLLDLRQLETWSERHTEEYPPERYADVGIALPQDWPDTQVPGAYSRRGWEDLVRELIDAVERTGGASSETVGQFRDGYVARFDASWRQYLIDTPTAAQPQPAVTESPYLELIERIDRNTRAELPRKGRAPVWISTLQKVRREEPQEGEEAAPPWPRYMAVLDQIAADVAATQSQSGRALDSALRMGDPQATSFGEALALIRELVPTAGDPQATAKLREILAMPVLNGASAVLDASMLELEQRWQQRIALPYAGRLSTQQLEALYASDAGDLTSFVEESLGPFYADGGSRPVLADRGLPLGEAFLAWMDSAETVQNALFPGGGARPQISLRLEGIPSRVVSGSQLFVTRRDLRVACADGVDTFVYREGIGSHGFVWSPDCQEVSLRIWARAPGGLEHELLPRREWSGPLALPDFLREGQSLGGSRLQWRLQYEGAELLLEYRLRSGAGILAIAHHPPPRSMRD
jgi:type VI secretion system protein ImpL